jgi:hypothetical protein
MSAPQKQEMTSGLGKGALAEASMETHSPAPEETQPPAVNFSTSTFRFPSNAPQIDFSQPQRKTSTIDPPPGPFGGANLFSSPPFGTSQPIPTPRTNTTRPKSVLDNAGAVQDRKTSFQGLFGALSDAKPTPSLFASQQQTSGFKTASQVPEKKQDVRKSEDQALE